MRIEFASNSYISKENAQFLLRVTLRNGLRRVEERELINAMCRGNRKRTEMPEGWLPPHPWLLRGFYLLGRTSKVESLAISPAPPSPFAWGG